MVKRVLVYGMKDCGYCTTLKEKLNNLNVKYVNKDIHIYADEYDKIYNELGTDLIPLVSVGGVWLLPEKDFTTIDECVEKINNLIFN